MTTRQSNMTNSWKLFHKNLPWWSWSSCFPVNIDKHIPSMGIMVSCASGLNRGANGVFTILLVDCQCTAKLCDQHQQWPHLCRIHNHAWIDQVRASLSNAVHLQSVLDLINSVKSAASAANPPFPEIDSKQYNNHLDAACNLINYKNIEQI